MAQRASSSPLSLGGKSVGRALFVALPDSLTTQGKGKLPIRDLVTAAGTGCCPVRRAERPTVMDVPPTTDHPAAPAARRRPGVPARPTVTVGGSRPVSAINRRARWPGFAVFLLAMGGLTIGLGVAAGTVPVSVQPKSTA